MTGLVLKFRKQLHKLLLFPGNGNVSIIIHNKVTTIPANIFLYPVDIDRVGTVHRQKSGPLNAHRCPLELWTRLPFSIG
jgi:hypothetical protein